MKNNVTEKETRQNEGKYDDDPVGYRQKVLMNRLKREEQERQEHARQNPAPNLYRDVGRAPEQSPGTLSRPALPGFQRSEYHSGYEPNAPVNYSPGRELGNPRYSSVEKPTGSHYNPAPNMFDRASAGFTPADRAAELERRKDVAKERLRHDQELRSRRVDRSLTANVPLGQQDPFSGLNPVVQSHPYSPEQVHRVPPAEELKGYRPSFVKGYTPEPWERRGSAGKGGRRNESRSQYITALVDSLLLS